MALITEDMTINDVVKKYPETLKVFKKHNVDSCCGGGQSIATTAAMGNTDIPRLMEELNAVASKGN